MQTFLWRPSLLFLAVGVLSLTACSDSQIPPRSDRSAKGSVSPEELLAKLRTTYTQASSYSDNAILQLRGVSRSSGGLTQMPFTQLSLLFARPNRYAISYEDVIPSSRGRTQYRVVSDGKRIRSSASQLPEQIHEAIAPRETTTENLIPEPKLRSAILQVSLENLFPQLVMLLTEDADKPVFPRATRMDLLSEEKIDDSACYRLSLTEPEGNRVLWIDKEKLILRRMEMPIDEQRDVLDPAKQFVSFSVDLDFENVALDAEFDDSAVTLEVPDGGILVRRFIPPPPTGPSDRLGRPVKDFKFTDAQGNDVTPALLAGKIVVLDFWATDCPPCKANTPVLEAAYQRVKGQDDVAFYGVNTDPKGLGTSAIEKTHQSWGATFPSLRDLEKNAYYQLDVKATPTLLVIGPDNRLQAMHLGILESAGDLVTKINQLRDGTDLVEQAKQEYTRQLKQHVAILAAATLERSLVPETVSLPDVTPRQLPEKLQAEELWSRELPHAGTASGVILLSTTSGELQEILTLENGRTVVRYDSAGNQLGQVELPEHEEDSEGFIRTALDAEGNRTFLVSGVGWQQVYLYDKDWKLLFAFPDEPHSGIGDAEFFNLQASDSPSVVVGYWGGLGVQAGSSDGQRHWVNRHLDHVLHLAAGLLKDSGEQSVWCTSTRGTVFELDAEGKSEREIAVVGLTMESLASAPNVSDRPRCGLGFAKPGHYEVVTFDKNGEVDWRYTLPIGEYESTAPHLQRIDLGEQQDSFVAVGPEGSVHFISASGKLHDRFNYGERIRGLAAISSDDGAILYISAGKHLTAWRIVADSAP